MVAKRTSKPLKRYLLTKGKQNQYSASNKDLKRGFYKWLKCQLVLSKERQHQSNIITEILKKKTGKQNTIITSIENEKRIINICNRLPFERNMTSFLAKKWNRSEERRVGKEGRERREEEHKKKKESEKEGR